MSKDLAQKQQEWDLHETPEAFIPLEFTEEIKPDLFGLEVEKANEMVSGLYVTLAEREVLKKSFISVIELPITTETLPVFKELRLKIVKNRTQGLDAWKEREKAFYLAGGNFVQAIYNKELAINKDMEYKLFEAEKFFENQEKEKARLLNLERIEKIRPYVEDVTGLDFSDFDDESFDDYILGKKTRFENEAKEREAESLRVENERLAEIEKQKAIQAENERLKKEAEEKEKAIQEEKRLAKIESDRIESENNAKLKIEREAKENLEKELQAKKEAEQKAEEERLQKEADAKKEAEKLSKAPIKKQLNVWVDEFSISIPNYELLNNEVALDIKNKFDAFKKWAKSEIEKL